MTATTHTSHHPRHPLVLSLYLVTDTRMSQPLGLDATVRAAVAGGATLVQLRDKDASDEEFVDLGRLVHRALEGTGVPLIINDRVHLVEQIGAEGALRRLDAVLACREALERNVKPQIAIEALMTTLWSG